MSLRTSCWPSLIASCILAGHTLVAQAQTIRTFRYLTTDDGLPHMNVSSAYQDSVGYMWFATNAGVVRWDGYEFKPFGRIRYYDEHPPGSMPLWVGGGARREILVGGYGGLASIDPEGHMTTPLGNSVQTRWGAARWHAVNGVYVAPSEPGVYWVSTYGGGLVLWDRIADSVRVFLPEPGEPHSIPCPNVTLPVEGKGGELWVPTEAGLCRLDRSDMTFQKVTDEHVFAVAQDPERADILWLAETDGLSRYDLSTNQGERVFHYPTAVTEPVSNPFRYGAMAQSMVWDVTAPGVLWVAAYTAGLYRYDTRSGEVERYPPFREPGHRGPAPSGSPLCVFQDSGGVIWVCTFASGINYAEPNSGGSVGVSTSRFMSPQSTEGSLGYVTAVTEDRRGRWWVGNRDSERRHLLMIDRHTGEKRRWFGASSEPNGEMVPFGEIFAVLEDRHGDIWIGEIHIEYIGTLSGEIGHLVWEKGAVHRLILDEERFETYRYDDGDPDGMPDGGIVSLHEDSDGIIWAGTRNHGIARIDPESGATSTVDISDHSNSAWGFLEDSQDRLWVGTHDGICLVNKLSRTCESFSFPEHSEGNTVEMAERPSVPGIVWVGTWMGLFSFDTQSKTFSRPASSGPLTTIHIVDLVVDENSVLWMSTDGDGVFRFDPETGATTQLEQRKAYYGLGTGMLTSEGDVVFGSMGLGLRVFEPNAVISAQKPPRVHVTRVSGPGVGVHELSGDEDIRLEKYGLSFSVEYVALHYSDPTRNEYAYKLEGLHDDWQYVGVSRSATFGDLAPGTYTFRVKAASAHGVWNEEGASIRIIVPPPWWRTGWAYALYSILVLGALFAAERLRHASIVRRERHKAALRERDIRSGVAEAKAVQAAEHAQRLEQLDEAKSEFFANVSHEFRTPLTLILGAAEDVSTGRFGKASEGLRNAVQLIVRNARHVDALVRELLDLSRLESGNMELNLGRGDLAETVCDVIRSHTPLAERRKVELGYSRPKEPVMASFDEARIRTAVGNLLSNAIKFTEAGGRVDVSLQSDEGPEEDMTRIDVSDTGIGIRAEDLGTIFDRFAQVDTSATRKTGGIGIGLSLVKELVELHGGSVEVKSEFGVGSTFTIHLPVGEILESDQEPSAAPLEAVAPVIPEKAPRVQSEEPDLPPDETSPVVLIVEDNPDVRAFLRGHFGSRYRVLEAADGEQGLRMTHNHHPDLVISDIMMPVMDGIELCKTIKGDPELRNIPVILVTARAGEAEALEGLQAGADKYVTKPFSVSLLVQMAANAIESRARLRTDAERKITVEPVGITVESQGESLLRRVLQVIEAHMGDAYFTVDMLASEVGLSRRQLERRLPDLCGDAPSDLVRRMRLERARQLLEADVGTVSEITYASGYRSASRFASAFRRAYGLTPSEYRDSVNGS